MAPPRSNLHDVNGGEEDVDVEAFVRHPPMGLSTLDLLARTSLDGVTAWQDQAVPTKVRREMHQLAKVEMAESLRTQQADRPRVHDMNTLGLPKDPPPLGAQINRTKKPNFVHGAPIQRRLIAGKLIRTSDLEECMLSSSASAPELSRAIARQIKGLKDQPENEQDALDLAMNSAVKASSREEQKPHQSVPQRDADPTEQERRALRQQENQLQTKLLHVTQKLTRKYAKQLNPRAKGPATTCKIHSLAQKWEEQHQDPEDSTSVSAAVDNERYNLYAAGRFSTQTEVDYYARKIEPREPATDKHRRHTMHTKYGNALAKNKCSLRGPF